PVNDPGATPRVLAPRERGVLYRADHVGNRWIVLTDWQAPNMRVMAVDDGQTGDKARWREIVPHDPNAYVDSFAVFADHLALSEWSEGLLRIRYAPWSDLPRWAYVRSEEPAYSMGFSVNAEQATPLLRYTYSSLTTPESVYQLDMRNGER